MTKLFEADSPSDTLYNVLQYIYWVKNHLLWERNHGFCLTPAFFTLLPI